MPLDFSEKAKPEEIETSIATILEPLKRAALSVYFPETDKYGNPCLSRFFIENRRLPFVTDEIKPWRYRGWLVPYLQMSENHPQVAKRYDYVLRTIDAGRLLDEPLPQVRFCSEFSAEVKPGMRMLGKCLQTVEYRSGSWNGIRELCEWIGFALGVTTEASKLGEDVQEFLYRNFNLEPLLLNPSDYLGQMLCETSHGKKNGFYPTPINICECMVAMTSGDLSGGDRRHETVMDPAVGTGRMLLVASNYSMRLFGQDIDYLCVLITKINLALYAPWFYIPESFFPEKRKENEQTVPGKREIIIKPAAEAPKALFDLSQSPAEAPRKKKSSGRRYTTEIEQPTLFDLD